MTSADVRTRLTAALALDLIGPAPGSSHANERIDRPPSRWYLTGFLAPWNAPATQKKDDDPLEVLELSQAGGSVRVVRDGTALLPAMFELIAERLRACCTTPRSAKDVEQAFNIVPAQAKAWLVRATEEGLLRKLSRPVRYEATERRLFT